MVNKLIIKYHRPPNRTTILETKVFQRNPDRIICTHSLDPTAPIIIDNQVKMDKGFTAIWFLFAGKGWDLGKIYHSTGRWLGYYADIIRPCQLRGNPIEMVDLFLDLWIEPNGRYTILDEAEFESEEDVDFALETLTDISVYMSMNS